MPAEDHSTTAELLRRSADGEGEALDALIEKHRDKLLTRIRLMMGDGARREADSLDFLQTVMTKVLANLDGFEHRGQGAFLRWATEIARNDIRKTARHQREASIERLCSGDWQDLLPQLDATPSQEAVKRERIDALIDTLAALPEDQQRVIELRDFERLPFRAIAEAMQRTENAVQLLHTRAVTRLGEELRRPAGP